MTVTIRKLSGSDAAEYRAIRLEGLLAHPEAFGASWEDESLMTVDDFAERLERQPVFGAFLAETGAMVGTVGIKVPTASKTTHKGMIWGMYVRQEARGLGVGVALIQHVLDYSRPFLEQITLVVEASNVSAQKLYRKMGFEQYGYEPRALKIGNTYYDDVLMTLALKD
ncbi:GNAT family N-acetyltransferase [Rhizobium sp. Leaf311]|uniref:GNAT family N-acetyltransferase n=1 Tax=Rhizobium sp. Leaf311 TaxID=1736332 RepID=UPI000AA4FA66|nr:GNAT family N-acetyltransferase [Rhizobium sp. Leaf311]